jgi:predicted aspartyl protease
MVDDMGIFRTTVAFAPLTQPDKRRELEVMVDTGSEYNWVPRAILSDLGVEPQDMENFETADGRVLEREVGSALLYAAGRVRATVVVFAEEGDMALLGAIGLEALNLRVDLARRKLVPAGPVPVAVALLGERAQHGRARKNTSEHEYCNDVVGA